MNTTIEEINGQSRQDGFGWVTPIRSDEFSMTMQFLLDHNATHNFIEIGVKEGGSFRLWSHYFSGIKIGVDADPPFDGMDSIPDSHGVHGFSISPGTIEQVETLLAGELVDWLFIDGDHRPSPNGPEPDYHSYKQFVRPGGYIGFHDINHGGHRNIGIFWNSLIGEKIEFNNGQLGILTKV